MGKWAGGWLGLEVLDPHPEQELFENPPAEICFGRKIFLFFLFYWKTFQGTNQTDWEF